MCSSRSRIAKVFVFLLSEACWRIEIDLTRPEIFFQYRYKGIGCSQIFPSCFSRSQFCEWTFLRVFTSLNLSFKFFLFVKSSLVVISRISFLSLELPLNGISACHILFLFFLKREGNQVSRVKWNDALSGNFQVQLGYHWAAAVSILGVHHRTGCHNYSHLWVRMFWEGFPFFLIYHIAAVQFCVTSVSQYLFSFGSWSLNFLFFFFLLRNLFTCLLPEIKFPETDPMFFRRGFQQVWTYIGL